jgi:hypothetical protein
MPGGIELDVERRIPGRNATKADVLLVTRDGRRCAIKSYAARPFVIRTTLGRWLVARECAAYRAAAGADGLPRFLGRIGTYALAVEWIEGQSLASLGACRLDPRVFDRLAAIVEGLHARGIALGDLHHRDVLVGEDDRVAVVDLATAVTLGERPGFLRRRAFERLRMLDRVAVARLRARFTGVPEAEALEGIPEEALRWHRRGRRLKAAWDALRRRRR